MSVAVLDVRPRAVPPSVPVTVQIQTFGQFAVRVHDQALAFDRKVPRRPIDLLKVLIALGGREVRETAVTDLLWPDADGDAAHQALATTLHRLRRLLRQRRAVRVQDGRLGLDPAACWVDVWALDAALASAERPSLDLDARSASLAEALALYHGPFLEGDADEPWTVPIRERVKARLLRDLADLARGLELRGELARATGLLERGLEVDDCAEEIYQRLMRAYLRAGRRADALRVYERCRRTLAAVLQVEPSAETESIRRAVGLAAAPAVRGALATVRRA